MTYTVRPLKFGKDTLQGISAKTMEIHHDKLYTGYVNKRNEIMEQLEKADRSKAHHSYSEYRALKLEETYNADGQVLHELFFDCLGGKGQPQGRVADKIKQDFGSVEAFMEDATACAMAARGWAVTAYDPIDDRIHNYLCDAHNQGGVWGTIPLFTLDMYEHAYFMDYGSDRKSYLQALWKNVDWAAIDRRFGAVTQIRRAA